MRNERSLRLLACPVLAAAMLACAGEDVTYRPAPQILPQHIAKLALRPVVNKTQQPGLEDKLTRRIIDEFLRDGRYPMVPESDSDGVVVVTLTRYILIPTMYDTVMAPTAYKLIILVNIDFIDRTKNAILWTEPNIEGVQSYIPPTLQGGMTEEQARELLWDVLARQIVKRTVEGFGAVSGSSQRKISSEIPPSETQAPPVKPINPNPY
ncbi:MAG: hypothetical protein HY922_13800 [Elusimicrobia bacterium]|nr:hypothetical protein [Elusimicrobiota bacterium]